MAQTLNKNQLGHTRVGLSIDLKRAHIKRPRKKWRGSSVRRAQPQTRTRFAQRWMKKNQQIKSKQDSRLLVAEILHHHLLLLSLSLCLLLLSPYTQRSLRWSIHQVFLRIILWKFISHCRSRVRACVCVDFAQEWIRVFEYLHFYWISIFHEISLHISFSNSHIVKFLLITFFSNFIWGFIAS